MKKLFAFLLVFSFIALAWAQEYGPGSVQVARVRRAFVMSGKLFPQTSFPVSRLRLEELASRIGVSLEGIMPPEPGFADAYGFLELTYDTRFSSATTLVQPDAPRDGIDLQNSYIGRPPLFRFGGAIVSSTGLSMEAEGEVRKEWGGKWFSFDNLPVDAGPGQGFLFENHVLRRGILSYENDAFRAWIGRDAVHFGPAGLSTLYPSSRLPYLDSGRFQTALGDFHFDWVLGTFHSIKSWEAVDIDSLQGFNPANSGFWDANPNASTEASSPTAIYFGVHRFGYTGEKFRFAIGEEIFYARQYDVLEANDILPIATWHGLDLVPDNMALILELGYAILPGLSVHGFAGFDDISTDIFGVMDSPVPTIDAYILSTEYGLGDERFAVNGIAEAGYTHYLWGNFNADQTQSRSPGINPMYLAKHVARYAYDCGGVLLPFSSPYGPGALWFRTSNDVDIGVSGLKIGLDGLVLSKNDKANLIQTVFQKDETIANASRTLFIDVSLPVSYEFELGPVSMTFCLAPSVQLLRDIFSAAIDISGRISIGRGARDLDN